MKLSPAGGVGALLILLCGSACDAPGTSEREEVAQATVGNTSEGDEGRASGPGLSLEVPDAVDAGQTVAFRLYLTNEGEEQARLELRGRPAAFDIVVQDAGGSRVWRRLEGQTVSAILQVRTLAPGDSLELRETWDQRGPDGTFVEPGTYTVRGYLPTVSRGRLEAPPVEFRILGPDGRDARPGPGRRPRGPGRVSRQDPGCGDDSDPVSEADVPGRRAARGRCRHPFDRHGDRVLSERRVVVDPLLARGG